MPHLATILTDTIRLALWLAILSAIFVPLEHFFALQERSRTQRRAGLAADLGLYFVNSLLPGLLLGVPMAAVAVAAHHLLPANYFLAVDQVPLWLRLVASFALGELGFYWGHRLMHASPLLWRFHATHHAPETIDWLINTRAHPVDVVFTRLCGFTPLYALGLAGSRAAKGNLPAILLVILGTIWGFFLHANVRWRLGVFEQAIASPRFHRWHHARSGPLDRNFASMLPLLDRLFGTFHLPEKAWPQDYGLAETAEQ